MGRFQKKNMGYSKRLASQDIHSGASDIYSEQPKVVCSICLTSHTMRPTLIHATQFLFSCFMYGFDSFFCITRKKSFTIYLPTSIQKI